DRAVEWSESLSRNGDGILDAGFISDVGRDEADVSAQLSGQLFALVLVEIGDDDVGVVFDQHAHTCRAESGAAAADQEGVVLDFHALTIDQKKAAGNNCQDGLHHGQSFKIQFEQE